jgi:glycosyltransferase involved in cell wall biosynthesis
MLLNAVAQLRKLGCAVQLDVVGDGPMRDSWMELSHSLGLAQCVIFHGAQPFDEVAKYMQACHVFCLPSIRESGGAVLLEAMASARPVIGLNFGGPGEIVDAEIGALLPLTSPEQVTADLVTSLRDVINNPMSWRQRGEIGRQRVEQRYSWPAKILAAQNLYQQVISEWSKSCH